MKVIIDANVWIKYARTKSIAPLLNRFLLYSLTPVVNNYLLSEIVDALVENKWMHPRDAKLVTEFIKSIAITTVETAVYAISPDPKDNYLFDLAIQNNCVFIISDDTLLIKFTMKPVPVHPSQWFLKKFPI